MEQWEAEVRDAVKKMQANTDAFMDARKVKEAEIQARLLELEQKGARPRDGSSLQSDDGEDVGSLVIKSQGLDSLRTGEVKTLRIPVKSISTKATITTGQNYFGVPDRDPEIYGTLPRRVTVQDLIPTRPTSLGVIEYLRAPRTGSAATQLSTGSPPLTEGATKAEIGLNVTLTQAKVETVAAWTSASRQVLDDNGQLQDFINSTLLDAVSLATEDQILNGSGVSPGNLEGLLLAASTYSRAVGGDNSADTLRRALTQVQLARGVPTGIVINPVAAEGLELLKDDQHRYLLQLEVTDSNGRTVIWRVPTVVTDAIAETAFLVGDFSRAARIFDRQQAMIAISMEHADYFVRNLCAILGERRLALTIPRPELLITGTFS